MLEVLKRHGFTVQVCKGPTKYTVNNTPMPIESVETLYRECLKREYREGTNHYKRSK